VDDYRALIQKWGTVWESVIRARRRRPAPGEVDPHIIMGWLANGNQGRTVFEVTLRIWAAFVGDTRGNRPVDWLEAYILRHNVKPAGARALGRVAAEILNHLDALGKLRSDLVVVCDASLLGPSGKPELDSDDFLDDLIARRLLSKHRDRIGFQHSLAAAYCAGAALAEDSNLDIGAAPLWNRALCYFAPLGDLTPLVGRRLTQPTDVLQTELLACALWLRDAPTSAKWRNDVFRRLAKVMMDTNLPESLRARALTGFVASGDPAVGALFKQALTSPDPFNRRMATLGLGVLGDASVVPSLAPLFKDPYLDVRWASALALANLGAEAAIDTLVQGLVQGDDTLRQACAQALARQSEVGHPLLKEAVTHENIGVRRAAVYGLADTHAEWAKTLLEGVQKNEQQWIVRNAAVEKLEQWKAPVDHKPRPFLPPESQGWLVSWAASKGTGVPPGRAAIEVLNRALKEGDEATRLAAAQSLGRLGDPVAARELYAMLRDPAPLIREVAFRALLQVAASSGLKLAAPVN
jgi:HEAT repeat protein